MARLLRFVAVAALVGGATASLTACSGDPGPIVTETPSPTRTVEATPSPTPTPTVTSEEELLAQIPEAARGEDFQSATQFSRFFLGLYPHLFTRGETKEELFALLAGENCGFCRNALVNAEETAAVDAYSVGGEISYPNVVAAGGLQDDGYWYVADRFLAAETSTYGPGGELVDAAASFSGEARFRLEFVDGHWRIDEIDLEFDNA